MFSIGTLLAITLAVLTLGAALASVVVVDRLHDSEEGWLDIARSRLVMGVPWGSLIVIGLVCGVYLFVQDGISSINDPVTIPHRAYSYFYPLGMLTSSFSHASASHLMGNLAGAMVLAPIAEYAWGHYPDERATERFPWWPTTPWVRAVVVFPLVVVGLTLVTSLFALGPVIGFSGVVFAFAAFAIVHYPIVSLVGILGVQGALVTTYQALQSPIGVFVAQPSPPSAPSWAGIAIQGHALGFFLGLVLGIGLLRLRNQQPNARWVWLGVLLFAFAQGLWQIYWFGGENVYYLFRGPGVFLVFVLALVITVAIAGTEESIVPRRLRSMGDATARDEANAPLERALELARRSVDHAPSPTGRLERIDAMARGPHSSGRSRLAAFGQRRTGTVIVVIVLAILAGMAVPVNLFVLEDATPESDSAVEIEDYTVQYAEDVENEMTTPFAIGPLQDAISLESSGVIVASEQRQLWSEAIPAQNLEFSGSDSVDVGGVGWRETVHVERTGWEPVGNDSVYQVELWADGEDPQVAHESNESRADVQLEGQNVTLASTDGTFEFAVESTETGDVETTPIPDGNESTTAGSLTFERESDPDNDSAETIYAVADGTQVAVASEETYE